MPGPIKWQRWYTIIILRRMQRTVQIVMTIFIKYTYNEPLKTYTQLLEFNFPQLFLHVIQLFFISQFVSCYTSELQIQSLFHGRVRLSKSTCQSSSYTSSYEHETNMELNEICNNWGKLTSIKCMFVYINNNYRYKKKN